MKPRTELEQLITQAKVFLKDPIGSARTAEEICIYGVLKTDVMMANQALIRNSLPMIKHYIETLKLHVGGPDAKTQEESKNNG